MVTKRKSSPKSKQKHISKTQTHIMLRRSMFVYMLIVFIAFILVSLSAYSIVNVYTAYHNQQRYDRIVSIYNKLDLGTGFAPTKSNIFGDKRVYSYDVSRSESSSIEGGHNDTPTNTIASLTDKIKSAGFTQVGGAYENSVAPQYYFKDDKGEYIRLQVTNSSFQNHLIYNIPFDTPADKVEWQKGPSYFTLKVNLDDNNE